MGGISGFGVTAGAHRFWCHRAYKAKLPLRILLMLAYCSAGQVCLTIINQLAGILTILFSEHTLRLGKRSSGSS